MRGSKYAAPVEPGHATSIWVRPEDERTLANAREMARDMGIPFTALLCSALEDYLTLHQHLVTGEVRRVTLAPDYKRT